MPFTTFSHENLKVRYQFPATPKALLAAFHGRGGSSQGVTSDAEWLAFLSAAIADGYAVVVSESKNRLMKKWDLDSPPANADIDNMSEIIIRLRSEFGLASGLPTVGIGHSNGGKFAACYGHYGNLSAVALIHTGGEGEDAVGDLVEMPAYDTPTVFTCGSVDTTAPCSEVEPPFQVLQARGVASALHIDQGSGHPFSAQNKAQIIGFLNGCIA